MLIYSHENMANELEVSTSTIAEIKKKLKIVGCVNEAEYERIKRFANDVRKQEGKASLSRINRFLINHSIENYRR